MSDGQEQEEQTALQEFVEEAQETLTKRWRAFKKWRPWYLRGSAWKRILLDPFSFHFDWIPKRVRRYREAREIRQQLEAIQYVLPQVFRFGPKGYRKIPRWSHVNLRIQNDLRDVEPILEFFFREGWEVDEMRDDRTGRMWYLEHPDRTLTLVINAYSSSGAECRVVTKEEEVVEVKQTYELVCPGEEELTGVEL